MSESLFVVGLFAAGLAVGYLAGSRVTTAVVEQTVPSNYDPARAAFADALRIQQEATAACWKTVVGQLQRERGDK